MHIEEIDHVLFFVSSCATILGLTDGYQVANAAWSFLTAVMMVPETHCLTYFPLGRVSISAWPLRLVRLSFLATEITVLLAIVAGGVKVSRGQRIGSIVYHGRLTLANSPWMLPA